MKTEHEQEPALEPGQGSLAKLDRGVSLFFAGLSGLMIGAVLGLGSVLLLFALLGQLMLWTGDIAGPGDGGMSVLGAILAVPGALLGAVVGLIVKVSKARRDSLPPPPHSPKAVKSDQPKFTIQPPPHPHEASGAQKLGPSVQTPRLSGEDSSRRTW